LHIIHIVVITLG